MEGHTKFVAALVAAFAIMAVSFAMGRDFGIRDTLSDVESFGFKAAYKRYWHWEHCTEEEARQHRLELERIKHNR